MIKRYLGICLIFLVCACNFSKKNPIEHNTTVRENFSEGNDIYNDFCIQCHMANGKGVPKVFPPLAASDYLQSNRVKSIKAIKYGLSGEIEVNGVKYNSAMAPQGLSNKEIADVMNYITNSWGNKNTLLITEDEVSKVER